MDVADAFQFFGDNFRILQSRHSRTARCSPGCRMPPRGCGNGHGVEQAAEELKTAGAKRLVMLNVSGPFHSPLLKPAGEELLKELENVEIGKLEIPYVTNVTAEYVENEDEIKELLGKQVSSSVRWEQSIRKMIEEGVDTFVEIGPGKTLAGFMRKISRDVSMYNIGTWEDVDKVAEALK